MYEGYANMRILISTDCYLFNIGGITASVLALCTGLRRLGHEVKTLSLSNCGRSFKDGDDYYIRSFPAFYYPGMRISFAMHDSLLKELEEWDPDLIHIQTVSHGLRVLCFRKIQVVASRQSDNAQGGKDFVSTGCQSNRAFSKGR